MFTCLIVFLFCCQKIREFRSFHSSHFLLSIEKENECSELCEDEKKNVVTTTFSISHHSLLHHVGVSPQEYWGIKRKKERKRKKIDKKKSQNENGFQFRCVRV